MKAFDLNDIMVQLRTALEQDNLDAAIQTLEILRSPDQADLFAELDEDEQIALLAQLSPATSADILEELEDEDAAELVLALPTETASRIVDEMAADEAADLLSEIEPEQARAILARLEDPEEIHPLLLHPDDSAGGLMSSEFLALRRRMTAGDALRAIRQWKEEDEPVHDLFVVDAERHLCGQVSLRQLLVADPATPLLELLDPDMIAVPVGTDQEECARLMSRYDLLALPVVDHNNVLLGVITIDDVVDVLEQEATEDFQRLGGAEPLEQPYLSTGVLTIARKRVGWLMLLFVTESLTGTVLRHFENELQAAVALAFFVPLLIGTGGNAGSQTTSTIIRALAVGDISMRDGLLALWHELRVGLLLGLGMSLFAFVRALTWGTDDRLALTVAIAIFTIVIWANALGALLPILAARLRIDPTVVSGPVMSTLVDATGLFIYFTMARLILGL
ncbi:MAG: Magnesium transporter MgtE [Anaerolineae bacterium]|nr:Magnesium transporter MgtE [Anaerolineae bacterium]